MAELRADIRAALDRMAGGKIGLKKRLRQLSEALREGEQVRAIASGRGAGGFGALVLTGRRILFVRAGVPPEETGLVAVTGVDVARGLSTAAITITSRTAPPARIKGVPKPDAAAFAELARSAAGPPAPSISVHLAGGGRTVITPERGSTTPGPPSPAPEPAPVRLSEEELAAARDNNNWDPANYPSAAVGGPDGTGPVEPLPALKNAGSWATVFASDDRAMAFVQARGKLLTTPRRASGQGSIRRLPVDLVPLPAPDPKGRRNIAVVLDDGQQLGWIARDETDAYAAPLDALAAQGRHLRSTAEVHWDWDADPEDWREYEDDEWRDEVVFDIAVELPPPTQLVAVNGRPDGAVLPTGYQYLVKLAPGGRDLVEDRIAASTVPGQQVLWLALRPGATPRGRRMVLAAVDGQDVGELAQAGADTALAWLDRKSGPAACLALAGHRDGDLRPWHTCANPSD